MVSEKPWKPDALILLIAGLLLSMSLGSLLSQLAPDLLPAGVEVDETFLRFLVGTLAIQTAALVLLHHFLRRHDVRWQDILVNRQVPVMKVLGMGLGIGLLAVPVTLALLNVSVGIIKIFQLPPEKQTVVTVLEKTVEPAKRVWFALAALVLAPTIEEIFFRGIMYPYLKQRIGLWVAVSITSILFAAIHMNAVIFIPLVFLGFVLTWLYERTDSLLTPILTHAVFNAANFFLLVYQNELPRWLHERT
ncbi:MAG TPA: CPBP family intramembrane glutamic endopeptidase [Verrucomicrobiae bacterium]|nr:CPBP family intramembrane glutamic endopeptidase [Verrucomicrobiae bacterium]